MKPSMSQFRCFGGRKTVILDVRFVLVIPQFVIVFLLSLFCLSRFSRMHIYGLGISRLGVSRSVAWKVGFKKAHSAVSASGTASSSTWSLVISSVSISSQIFELWEGGIRASMMQ